MDTYIFYLCKDGGLFISLEARAFISDEVAAEWAQKILLQHPTADFVSVTRDGVSLLTQRRNVTRPAVEIRTNALVN